MQQMTISKRITQIKNLAQTVMREVKMKPKMMARRTSPRMRK